MSAALLRLVAAEAETACLLAGSHAVVLRAHAADLASLQRAGFERAPASIECFVRAPVDVARRPRSYRKKLRASFDAWSARRLQLELVRTRTFGVQRFLDEVYVPFFLRDMYTRGIAPHYANELSRAVNLAEGPSTLALVRDTGGALVGAALLGENDEGVERDDDAVHVVAGERPDGAWKEGLVYALAEGLGECRRAFMCELASATGAAGSRWFSLGRDLAWCEDGYDRVLCEKLHLADTVVVHLGAPDEVPLFSFAGLDDARVAAFTWDPAARMVRPKNFGLDDERFAGLAAYFTRPAASS